MAPPLLIACGAIALTWVLLFRVYKAPRTRPPPKLPPLPKIELGSLIDHRYEILHFLGEGGLGQVYRATDLKFHRPVAIKFIHESVRLHPQVEEQFFQEAIHTSQVNHPNLVTLYDHGHFRGHPYLIMEFLQGHTLDHHTLPPGNERTFLDLALQLLEGLETAHANRLFHGDIKPQNIMVTPSLHRRAPLLKIFDFGLSRILGNDVRPIIDTDDTLLGSLHYMAPEQFLGGIIDGRTDLYSAGMIFYEMLTGRLPFEDAATPEWIEQVVYSEPSPILHHAPHLSPHLPESIMRMIEREPSKRFASAGEALAAFQMNLERTVTRSPSDARS